MTSWILPEKEKPPSVDSDFSCIVLTVYKLTRNDFHNNTADVVHPLHPQHLIFRFEGFRYALFFGKLFYQPRKHCYSNSVYGYDFLINVLHHYKLTRFSNYTFVVPCISLVLHHYKLTRFSNTERNVTLKFKVLHHYKLTRFSNDISTSWLTSLFCTITNLQGSQTMLKERGIILGFAPLQTYKVLKLRLGHPSGQLSFAPLQTYKVLKQMPRTSKHL